MRLWKEALEFLLIWTRYSASKEINIPVSGSDLLPTIPGRSKILNSIILTEEASKKLFTAINKLKLKEMFRASFFMYRIETALRLKDRILL